MPAGKGKSRLFSPTEKWYQPHSRVGGVPRSSWPTQNELSGICVNFLFPSPLFGLFPPIPLYCLSLYTYFLFLSSFCFCFFPLF